MMMKIYKYLQYICIYCVTHLRQSNLEVGIETNANVHFHFSLMLFCYFYNIHIRGDFNLRCLMYMLLEHLFLYICLNSKRV